MRYSRLGELRGLTGDYRSAAADQLEALQLYRDLNEPLGQANALSRLGEVRQADRRLPRRRCRPATGARAVPEPGRTNRTGQHPDQARRGAAADRRPAGAARDLQLALRLYRDLGDRTGQAHALAPGLGEIRRQVGDHSGAATDQRQALELFQDLGEQVGQASALTFLGQALLSAGDITDAARYLKDAVDLFRRIGTRGGESWALNHYAAAILASGNHTRATFVYTQALHLARDTSQPDDEALALEGIGESYLRGTNADAGAAHLKQARTIYQRLNLKPDADRIRIRLARLGRTEDG